MRSWKRYAPTPRRAGSCPNNLISIPACSAPRSSWRGATRRSSPACTRAAKWSHLANRCGGIADPRPRRQAQNLDKRIRGDRRTHEKSLNGIAALGLEEFELCLGCHAFGDDLETQVVPERNNGAHDRGIVRILADVRDKGAIDLQRIERKALQIIQRTVAGTEVIDGERKSEFLERQQRTAPGFGIAHQNAFGQFQLEQRRRQFRLSDDIADLEQRLRMREVPPGYIHGNARRRQSRSTPLCHIAANPLQCPFADICNQASLLGDSDKIGGRNLTSRGMEPAQQRLSTHQIERSRSVFWLVVNLEA